MKKIGAGIDVAHIVLFLLTIVGFGLAAGMYAAEVNTEQFLDTGNNGALRVGEQLYVPANEVGEDFLVGDVAGDGFVVSGGKTWISIEQPPLALTIVNDPTCGVKCDPTTAIAVFRNGISPALIVVTVDSESTFGQELVEKFDVQGYPAYFVGKTIEEIDAEPGKSLPEVYPTIFKTIAGTDLYSVDPSLEKSLRPGMYLKDLDFELNPAATQGSEEAPVKVVEFSAYYCGYCEKFFNETGATVKKLVDAGEIEYSVKHFPIGDDYTPHYAAMCATEQDAFFEMHDILFGRKSEWLRAADKPAQMVTFAEEIGLNTQEFEECLGSDRVQEELAASVEIGRKYGVGGTPAFFFNNVSQPGFLQPAQFEAMVESVK
jgi:protein-disulfide isomerase